MSPKRNHPRKGGNGASGFNCPPGALFALDTLNLELRRLLASGDTIVPFGPLLQYVQGKQLSSSVVTHRLLKAYEVPLQTDVNKRKEDSIRAVLARDVVGFDTPNFASQRDRLVLLRVRRFITDLASVVKRSYRLIFPTGEGFTSLHGEKDLYYKLDNLSVWQCNAFSFKYVAEIFYRNPHMKRLVKKRYYAKQMAEFGFDRKTAAARLYRRFEGHGRKSFRSMLSTLVELVDVSRMTTVPKDNLKDRVITCEPLLTMVAQLSYMHDMRDALRKKTGLDITVLQDWHGARIRDKHVATLDLRNASNQVWLSVVKLAFGGAPKVLNTLLGLRTGTTQYGNEYHHFAMYSPMGCGLTFDVMTWILLGITRAHDPSGSVFGDDIICSASSASEVEISLKLFGLEINSSKSFSFGHFRESCGYFADVTNNRLITCYELRRPTNLMECVVAVNKLSVIIHQEPLLEPLKSALIRARDALLHFLPRAAFLEVSDPWVTDRNVLVPLGSGYVEYRYNKDWQRLEQCTSDLVPFRDQQGGLVTLALDTVRMLTLKNPRVTGASAIRYKWSKRALLR